ncbi:hypothetical protein SDC9_22822 [bioreactor metagenome]
MKKEVANAEICSGDVTVLSQCRRMVAAVGQRVVSTAGGLRCAEVWQQNAGMAVAAATLPAGSC